MTEEPRAARAAVDDLYLEIRDGLATLAFDRPDSKVNLLTAAVMQRLDELLAAIAEAIERGGVRALAVRSAKPRNFIAGADIDELAKFEDAETAAAISRRGQQIFQHLERIPVPTLAAIRGTCLGGGLELALACDYRVASRDPSTRLGLPETRLGILPGLGGTVRLPRLIGLRAALDLILSGKQIRPEHALKLGLIDRAVEPEGFEAEIDAIAQALVRGETPIPRKPLPLARALENRLPARWVIERLSRRAVLAQTKGHYPAPPAALEVTVSGLAVPPEQAHEREAAAFGKLAVTRECKNLIAVFKLTEGARKRQPPGEARVVARGAVVGAGVMGAGIAELFAYQAIPVHVVDIDAERVRSGVNHARDLLVKAARRASWSDEELQRRTGCLLGATDYDGFENVELVVEAVAEKMDIKRKVFALIEERVGATTVIATNTSALSVSELQGALEHPDRACGLHFFNPPHRMPLVEVVRGERTSGDALATAFNFAVRLAKTPVVVNDSPGFVVNRILAAYLTEAGHLLQSGMTIESVDRLMVHFGMPMGPLRLLDEIGLDVVAEVSQTMRSAFGERFEPAPIMREVLASGVTGRKGGRGFYIYNDSKARGTNQELVRLLSQRSAGAPPPSNQAMERMILSMINEAARLLDDAVVESPHSVDVAMILGTGFPPFRGGLLRYADKLGLDRVLERLHAYAGNLGPRFAPAHRLIDRQRFY